MTKVELNTSFVIKDPSETVGYRAHHHGEVIEVTDEEAERMVERQLATHVAAKPPPRKQTGDGAETAAKKQPEKAAGRRRRKKS